MGETKRFIKYVSLNVASMAGLSLYILADTFFIANGVGENGLVALNLTLPVYSLINGLGLMLGIGGATRFSIARGEGDHSHAAKVLMHALLPGVGIGLLLTLLGLLFTEPLMRLLGASQAVMPFAVRYLSTLLCFSVFFIVNNILIAFTRNDGAPKLAMAAMMTASFSNILLDYVFVYPLHWGIGGAAFATGLAPVLSICVLLFHLCSKKSTLRFLWVKLKVKTIGSILGAGLSSFVTEFANGIVMMLFNFVILRLLGDVGVGAYGIITNIALVCISMFSGVAQGIQPLVSRSYGAKKQEETRRYLRCALLTAVLFGVLFYGAGVLGREWTVRMFNSGGNPELQQIAVSGIPLYFTCFLLMGINIVAAAYLACVTKVKASFAVSLLRGLGFVALFLSFLPALLGMTGVWLVVPCAEAATCAASVFFLYKHAHQAGTPHS